MLLKCLLCIVFQLFWPFVWLYVGQVEDYVSGCTCQLTKVKAIYKTLYNIQTYRENKTEEMFGHQAITQ